MDWKTTQSCQGRPPFQEADGSHPPRSPGLAPLRLLSLDAISEAHIGTDSPTVVSQAQRWPREQGKGETQSRSWGTLPVGHPRGWVLASPFPEAGNTPVTHDHRVCFGERLAFPK